MSDFPFSIATTQPNLRPTAFKQTTVFRDLVVSGANPDDATNPGNQKGGAITELSTSIVLTEPNQNVFINCRVAGDLNVNSVDFGMILHRSGGGPSVFLRAPESGNRGRFITTNVISSTNDFSSGDSMVLTYVDTPTSAGTYIYTPVCMNSGDGGTKTYKLNRVQQSNDSIGFEVAVSTMVLQVI